MRIGILGDTHIRESAQLPPEIADSFSNVELILHTGDIYIPSVLDELEHIAPVIAVSGDDDYGAILTDKRVKPKQTLSLAHRTIVLIHDSEFYHSQRSSGFGTLESTDFLNIVIFGHTHYSILEQHNGTLFLNPGSPFLNNLHALGTVATLEFYSGGVKATIVKLPEETRKRKGVN